MSITEGCHAIPDGVYHADPCPEPSLSASICAVLLDRSPLHAWFSHPRLNPAYTETESSTFDLGKAAHRILLEGEAGVSVLVGYDDFKKKEARLWREQQRAAGKSPLLARQYNEASEMVRCLRSQLDRCVGASDAFTGGEPEMTLIWREGPTWFRARSDYLRPGVAGSPIDDYKTTTNSSPHAWQRQLFNNGCDIQAAFYRRGFRAVFGVDPGPFRFIVQENERPYAAAVVQLDPQALALATQKVEAAISAWRHCIDTGEWLGYASRVYYAGCPGWSEQMFSEKLYAMQCLGIVPETGSRSTSREFDVRRIMA